MGRERRQAAASGSDIPFSRCGREVGGEESARASGRLAPRASLAEEIDGEGRRGGEGGHLQTGGPPLPAANREISKRQHNPRRNPSARSFLSELGGEIETQDLHPDWSSPYQCL
jgi:hypothetical protein